MLKKIAIAFMIAIVLFGCAKTKTQPTEKATAVAETRTFPFPEFSQLFASLDNLQKTDFDKALASNYNMQPSDPFKAAFTLGTLSADAILATKARNKTKLQSIATAMIDYSKMLNVSDDILKLADELSGLIAQDKWADLETKLNEYRDKIEIALLETKQYDQLTLMQVGGWTQGLNRLSFLLNNNYKEDKTGILSQKGILNNMLMNIEKVENNTITSSPYFKAIQDNYKQISTIVNTDGKETFTKDEVKQLMSLSDGVLKAVK